MPPVTFEGAKKPNRVLASDGLGWLIRFRITGIVTETGGIISTQMGITVRNLTARLLPRLPAPAPTRR